MGGGHVVVVMECCVLGRYTGVQLACVACLGVLLRVLSVSVRA